MEATPGLRQQKAQRTRQTLMDSAARLFEAHGYAGTSMRAISRGVDLADGLMYHYFPGGKKELFQAVLLQKLTRMREEIRQEVDLPQFASLPLEDVLEQIFVSFDRVFVRHLSLFRILVQENDTRSILSRQVFGPVLEQNRTWLPELLRIRSEMGEIQPVDYDCSSQLYMDLLLHYEMARLLGILQENDDSLSQQRRMIRHLVSLWKRV